MSYGLLPGELEIILAVLRKYPNVTEAILFGSRAMGRQKKGSDVDIALKGTDIHIMQISHGLNSLSPLPYYFDILDYYVLENKQLKDHVDRVGVVIYTKL
jgi:predicted nucleotidyltransferase